jgi:hypothetical protein
MPGGTKPASPATGLPDNLKSGVESLSGMNLDQVKVHYNSSRPAQLDALAYAQGSDIHVGPGRQHTLAHEAWHVVQQKRGRVAPGVRTHIGLSTDPGTLAVENDLLAKRTPV